MMKNKYCLPIIKNTKKEVAKSLKIKGYGFYEIWLDYIQDLDDKFIVNIAKKAQEKLIFLFRRQNLQKIRLPLEKRQVIIVLLSKFNVFLDIDFLTQYDDLEFLRQNKDKIKLILSYHNYKETPKLDYLLNLISKMEKYNPDIFKIATMCNKETDALNLLNLLLKLKEQRLKYVVLGMGEKGLITRIFGPIWESELIFAPQNLKDKSALGQLTKKQLELILRELYAR